jgi:hypothetical protein
MYGGAHGPGSYSQIDPDRDDYWSLVEPWLAMNHFPLRVTVTGSGDVSWREPLDFFQRRHCAAKCERPSRRGDELLLEASETDSFWRFAGWGGACSGRGSCAVMITGPQEVTATFEPVVHLNVAVRGQGSVRVAARTCRKECIYEFAPRTKISIVAVARRGWRFERWRGGCRRTPQCTLTLRPETDVALAAIFTRGKRR